MFIDAAKLPDGAVIDSEVCIIGGGPAGLTVARELVARGKSVCLVESGAIRFDDRAQPNSELERGAGELHPLGRNRRRQLGGNANLWRIGRRPSRSLVRYLPLDADDFETRSWLPHSGWPFRREALDPHYARAHQAAGLGVFDYNVERAAPAGVNALPIDPDIAHSTVEWFGTARPFVRDAVRDLTRASNATVVVRATAVEIVPAPRTDRVDRVELIGGSGGRFAVRASSFVLATGGIENARLLLASRSNGEHCIGNEHDLVGRFFMDHLQLRGSFEPANASLFGRAGLYDVQTLPDGRTIGGKLHLAPRLLERERILNSALKLDARPRSNSILVSASTYGFLAARHKQLRPSSMGWSRLPRPERRYRDFSAHLQVELPPRPDNRVTLGNARDAFGRPRARVQWSWDPLTLRSIERSCALYAQALSVARLGKLEFASGNPPPLPNDEGINHHLGTTRMHDDPQHGVVDSRCRVHSMANLFVAGSSVFPTGGYANPTLTILALALRLADELAPVELSAANGA